MKKLIRTYLFLALVSGTIIFFDQLTKTWIRQTLLLGESFAPIAWLDPPLRIVHWYNTGVALGLFQDAGTILAILAFLVSLGIIYYYPRVPAADWTLRLAMALQLGGAVGNLIDRITIGHVTDFIAVGNFPVFNVADSSITVGVFVLILGVWLQEKREKAERQRNQEQDHLTSGSISEFREANE